MTSNDSKFEKVQADFQALSVVASSLNSASDELTKVVGILDGALQKLNIGLSVWVDYANRAEQPGEIDEDQIGYCKVNGKWGIGLRRVWGNSNEEFFDSEGPWLFNDSPREMRLKSVDKIPELIEALSKAATEMTKKVQEKTQGVRELAGVIEQIASADKKGLKPPPTTDAFAKHMQLLAEQGKSTSQSPGLPPPPAPASTAVWPTAKSVPLSALSGKNKEGGK
jgi:prefoldin subunit 5